MRMIKCDKCGREVEDKDNCIVLGLRNIEIPNLYDQGRRLDHIDLCNECGNSFYVWMTGYNKEV